MAVVWQLMWLWPGGSVHGSPYKCFSLSSRHQGKEVAREGRGRGALSGLATMNSLLQLLCSEQRSECISWGQRDVRENAGVIIILCLQLRGVRLLGENLCFRECKSYSYSHPSGTSRRFEHQEGVCTFLFKMEGI